MKTWITPCLMVIVFFACSDNESNLPDKHLYLAGSDNGRPAYWDGKDIVVLSSGTGRVLGIAKRGSTIYAGGYSSEFPGKMVVWADGEAKHFFDQEPHSNIGGFAMINDDFYFGGTLDSTKSDDPNYIYWKQVKYWKNGEGVVLSVKGSNRYNQTKPGFSTMRSIGNDLYVMGSSPVGAALWKNGLLTEICPDYNLDTTHPAAVDLAVDGDNTVVLYWGCDNGTIWNNGEVNEPRYDGKGLATWGIDVANDTLYIATQIYDQNAGILVPMYMQKPLNIQGRYTVKTLAFPFNVVATSDDIAVYGKDVYVLGSVFQPNTRIIVWKNGDVVAPFDGNNTSFRSRSMYIL